MFTGIIQAVGTIQSMQPRGGDLRLTVNTNTLDMTDVALGDSIAVNGVCLTIIAFTSSSFAADVSNETLSLTSLNQLRIGSEANLEKALTLQTRLGGHWVSGHVDGLGAVLQRYDDGRSVRFVMQAPRELGRYIAAKGSITVDGISLTVNSVKDTDEGTHFELNIVPHTLEETIMHQYQVGRKVNLEVDIIARYLERLLSGRGSDASALTPAFLADHGFHI